MHKLYPPSAVAIYKQGPNNKNFVMAPVVPSRPLPGDDYVLVPPDGGWGWVVVFASFYCQTVLDGVQLTFGMILKEIAEDYQVPYSHVSLIGSLVYGLHFLCGPFCTGLSYYFGERPVSIFGAVLAAASLSSAYFRPPVAVLYLLGVFAGLGLCFVNMNSIVITTLYFSQKRVLALGIVVCGTGAGTMIFTAVATQILKFTRWEFVTLIEGGIALTMAVAAASFRPLKATMIETDDRTTTVQKAVVTEAQHQEGNPKLYVVSKAELKGKAGRPSVSTFKEHTDKTYDNMAAAMNLVHVHKRRSRSGTCTWCKCRRKVELDETLVVLKMNPYIKQSLLIERPEPARRLSIEDDDRPTEKHRGWRTVLRHVCRTMTDFKLLKNPRFFLYCIAGALSASALIVVIFYEKVRVIRRGGTREDAMWYVIALGAFNMAWRLLLGGISLVPQVNYRAINWSGMILGGAFTMASSANENVYFEYLCGCFYSLAIACWAVFYPVILAEFVGLDQLSSATGITMLFMGIFSIIGAPLSGFAMELTKTVDTIFYIGGFMFTLAGVIFLCIPTREATNPV